MNIDVLGRIRPSLHGEGNLNLEIDNHHRLATGPGGSYFSFMTLYRQEISTYDLYQKSVDPMLDLFIAGFNVSLVVMGESGSGKSFTVAGESMNKSGILPIALDQLFSRLNLDDKYLYDSALNEEPASVNLSMFEVYNDQVRDLLVVPKTTNDYLLIEEIAEKGFNVKHSTSMPIRTGSDAISLFRQGWSRRSNAYTDFGPAINFAATIIQLELELQTKDDPFPHKSRFTIIEMPGAEKLMDDPTHLRLREGPTLNKGLTAFMETVQNLAQQPSPNRVINYSDSKLMSLMKDELGGNCKTRVIVCLKPNTDHKVLTPILRTCNHISQVKNFPIRNDSFAQQLLTQYRAEIIDLKKQLGVGVSLNNPTDMANAKDEMRRLQTENLQLKDKNERLHYRLDQLQAKFGNLATTKTDLSGQLLMTEEEKLKVSKTLVDMQIENNKLIEEMEQTKFELTNKVLQLENDLVKQELDRDKFRKAALNARERLEEIERERRDLADEYVTLKSNYLGLTKAHKAEVAKSDELSMELLNLVNAKAILMKQVENLEKAYGAVKGGQPISHSFGNPDAEVDRIKSMVGEHTARPKINVDQYKSSTPDKNAVEKDLLSNQRNFENEIHRMKNQYEDQQQTLEQKLDELQKELATQRNLVREKQQKISDLNAQLITTKQLNEELQHESNKLQNKMKDVNDNYKSRLNKWVEDIADYVDTGAGMPGKTATPEKYKEFVNKMVKDLKEAHKFREGQLAQAAQSFKRRAKNTVKRHEQLLVAYRNLRQTAEARGLTDDEMGPDETHFYIDDDELETSNKKEIEKLKSDVQRLENENERLKNSQNVKPKTDAASTDEKEDQPERWSNLRKQLREFTLTTQQELEDERANLLTKNTMLEEQLKDCQDYIDKHLIRYRDEITKLRGMLGMDARDGRITSMSGVSVYNRAARKN